VSSREKCVQLFEGDSLLASRFTDEHRPSEYYVVNERIYDVTSFLAIIESDGSAGFEAQVQPRS
jgi:hypothetical protein